MINGAWLVRLSRTRQLGLQRLSKARCTIARERAPGPVHLSLPQSPPPLFIFSEPQGGRAAKSRIHPKRTVFGRDRLLAAGKHDSGFPPIDARSRIRSGRPVARPPMMEAAPVKFAPVVESSRPGGRRRKERRGAATTSGSAGPRRLHAAERSPYSRAGLQVPFGPSFCRRTLPAPPPGDTGSRNSWDPA